MPESETAVLFVYGTLMSTASGALGRVERRRLASQSRLIGTACLPGRLYDLGDYPGLVPDAVSPPVTGEALLLANPEATFLWLDAYEGIDPARPSNEYRRERLAITVRAGEQLTAWVYALPELPAGARHIASGKWPA